MNGFHDQLDRIKKKKAGSYPALMTHVVLGYPSLKESMEIVLAMADGGASFIELQIPFSDPMADGPTIMKANEAALEQGVTPTDCLKAISKLSKKCPVPLLIMSYFNLIFAYGNKKADGNVLQFCKDAAAAGATGLIVPDVPPEENVEGYWTHSKSQGLAAIPLVSPVTSAARMKKIAQATDDGFVYCVSTTGTTGARNALPTGLAAYLQLVQKYFSQPRAVGFGISTAAQVKSISNHAEIAIVGSAMIDIIADAKKSKRLKAVRTFTKQLSGS